MAATLDAKLRLDSSAFTTGLRSAAANAESFATRLGSVTGIASLFGPLTLGVTALGVALAGIPLAIKSILDYGNDLRDLTDGFESLGDSAAAAGMEVQNLLALSTAPGVAFEQAGRAEIELRALGKTAQESRIIIEQLGNAIALAGRKDEELGPLVETLVKISDKGEISAKTFESLVARYPAIRKAFKDAFNVTSAKDFNDQLLSTDQILVGITKELRRGQQAVVDWQDSWRIMFDFIRVEGQAAARTLADAIIDTAAEWTQNVGMLFGIAPNAYKNFLKTMSGTLGDLREAQPAAPDEKQLETRQRALEIEQKRLQTIQEIRREIPLEIAAAEARSKHQKKLAESLEHEIALRQEIIKLTESGAYSEEDAARVAESLVSARERAAGQRQRIRTKSAEESDRAQFLRNVSLREKYGDYETYKSTRGTGHVMGGPFERPVTAESRLPESLNERIQREIGESLKKKFETTEETKKSHVDEMLKRFERRHGIDSSKRESTADKLGETNRLLTDIKAQLAQISKA